MDTTHNTSSASKTTTAIVWSLAVYLIWTLATYFLEGRIRLVHNPTITGRYLYVVIANILIGTLGAIWVMRSSLNARVVTLKQLGFRSPGRTFLTILIAVVIGSAYLFAMRPSDVPWLVVVNGYVQVLTVSIAEVVVCWGLIGTSVERLTTSKGKWLSLLLATVAATGLFSVYHIGHSAPFNQVNMMVFLLFPGIMTSLFYFISRDIYATILFHNFQGTVGVVGSLENPDVLNRLVYPLYLLLLLSLIALIGADLFLTRRAAVAAGGRAS